jgi:hypothetical protein
LKTKQWKLELFLFSASSSSFSEYLLWRRSPPTSSSTKGLVVYNIIYDTIRMRASSWSLQVRFQTAEGQDIPRGSRGGGGGAD